MGIKPIGDKPIKPVSGKVTRKQESSKNFSDLLANSDNPTDNSRLRKLYDNIEIAATNLIESTEQDTMAEYRTRVKEFLEQVLAESRELRVVQSGIYENILVIVKVIDEKLDQLASIVINEEVESGRIARMIDEIKGILVDLYR